MECTEEAPVSVWQSFWSGVVGKGGPWQVGV